MSLGFLAQQDDIQCYFLREGNTAFAMQNYVKAIEYYTLAKEAMPQLAKVIDANIELAERRQGNFSDTLLHKIDTSINIVVPIYNALEDVKRCLRSIEEHTDGFQMHAFVVNDASEIETTEWLNEFCKDNPLFTLIENAENLGYTKSVNIGLKASKAKYVILLNSDTIVTEGWLLGLLRCMESSVNLGIVGPLSNAANWQSVPQLKNSAGAFAINSLPHFFNLEDMAQFIALTSSRMYPPLNLINGFCFMIKRELIEKIGYMDEETFPEGYGEENDYCIRALEAQYSLAVADDVYIYHAKSKSFGEERRLELSALAKQQLIKKHGSERYSTAVNFETYSKGINRIRESIKSNLLKVEKLYTVALFPSCTANTYTATGYIRLVLPYSHEKIKAKWNVILSQTLPDYNTASIAVLQRTPFGVSKEYLQRWIIDWKKHDGKLIYDIDDDFFDSKELSLRISNPEQAKVQGEIVQLFLNSADVLTASTPSLAEKMRQFAQNTPIFIIPNALDIELWKLDVPLEEAQAQPSSLGKAIKIVYFGSRTHNEDLDMIADAMNIIKEKYNTKIEIEVIQGFAKEEPSFGSKLQLPEGKSSYPDFVTWLMESKRWDIGIIPLMDSSFNQSKSNIKFLDYAALGLAIVVSDVSTYHNIANHDYNCLIAKNTTEAWVEQLSRLIDDYDLREKLANNAREDCQKNYTLDVIAPYIGEVIFKTFDL